MSHIKAADEHRDDCGHPATNDPVLITTLGTLGFKLRKNLPISITADGNRIINYVDKGIGEVEKLVHAQYVCEGDCDSPDFGLITFKQVYWAHELARYGRKRDAGDLSPRIDREIERAQNKCHAHKVTLVLATTVRLLYDQVPNWSVLTGVVEELAKIPFLKFQRLLHRGIAQVAHPLEVDQIAHRQFEKKFRGLQ